MEQRDEEERKGTYPLMLIERCGVADLRREADRRKHECNHGEHHSDHHLDARRHLVPRDAKADEAARRQHKDHPKEVADVVARPTAQDHLHGDLAVGKAGVPVIHSRRQQVPLDQLIDTAQLKGQQPQPAVIELLLAQLHGEVEALDVKRERMQVEDLVEHEIIHPMRVYDAPLCIEHTSGARPRVLLHLGGVRKLNLRDLVVAEIARHILTILEHLRARRQLPLIKEADLHREGALLKVDVAHLVHAHAKDDEAGHLFCLLVFLALVCEVARQVEHRIVVTDDQRLGSMPVVASCFPQLEGAPLQCSLQ